jgi:hypothetical protein
MTENKETPEWVETLGEAIVSTIEFQGPAYIEWYYSKADENGQNVDLLELYPALVEIEEAGPYDGEIVFVKVNSVDILAAQKVLDEVHAVTFGYETEDQTNISIEGKYNGKDVVVVIYFEPSLDDEADDIE